MKTRRVAALVAGLLVALVAVNAHAEPIVNWNAVTADNIEYYMQTDSAVYALGEDVEMLYRVTNLGIETVSYGFTGGRQYSFQVEKDGETFFNTDLWPDTLAMTSLTLNPSESAEFTETWDMTDISGNPAGPGHYDVTGGLNHPSPNIYIPVSVSIDVIPEPTTLLLLGTGVLGMIGILRKRRMKRGKR